MAARGPSSKKPYLLRAMYEWIVDNDLTPHILVDAKSPGVSVPPSAVKDERVLLNLAPRAVFGLNLGNDFVSFKASFSGAQREVSFPLQSILALFAREDVQHGMVFGSEEDEESDESTTPESAAPEPLRVVRTLQAVSSAQTGLNELTSDAPEGDHAEQIPAELAKADESTDSPGEDPSQPPPPRGRANLRVIK